MLIALRIWWLLQGREVKWAHCKHLGENKGTLFLILICSLVTGDSSGECCFFLLFLASRSGIVYGNFFPLLSKANVYPLLGMKTRFFLFWIFWSRDVGWWHGTTQVIHLELLWCYWAARAAWRTLVALRTLSVREVTHSFVQAWDQEHVEVSWIIWRFLNDIMKWEMSGM